MHIYNRLPAFGLLAALVAVPSIGMATTPATNSSQPVPASNDPACGQAVVTIEIDVATGNLSLIDPDTGTSTSTDDDITVSFDSQEHVVVVLQYTSSDWDVTITPDDDPALSYGTNNGVLYYTISTDVDSYLIESSEDTSSSSSMMNFAPVVPDIILRPKKECPPST